VLGCDLDDVGEGIVLHEAISFEVSNNIIGQIKSQDGIEPAYSSWGHISNNTFTDSLEGQDALDIFFAKHVMINNNIAKFMTIQLTGTNSITFNGNTFEQYYWPTNIDNQDTNLVFTNNVISYAYIYGFKIVGNNSSYIKRVISNNTFYFIGTQPGYNITRAIQLEGDMNGLVIDNNNFIHRDATITGQRRALTGVSSSSQKAKNFTLTNNRFYGFNRGIYSSYDKMDSVIIKDNYFDGIKTDSIWVVNSGENPYKWEVNTSVIENNGSEFPLNTSDYSSSTTFTPVRGVMMYNIANDIDSINTTLFGIGFQITFVHDTTLTTERTISDGKNIILNDDQDWTSAKGEILTLQLIENNKWIETARTGTDYDSFNPIDSFVKSYIIAKGGKQVSGGVQADTLGDQSAELDHYALSNGTSYDRGDYITFLNTTQYTAISTTSEPGSSDFTLEFLIRPTATGVVARDEPGGGNVLRTDITSGGFFQVTLNDGTNNSAPFNSNALTWGRLYYLAAVVDRTAGTVSWYINGVYESQDDISSVTGAINPAGIDMRLGATTSSFDGDLYEFRYSIGVARTALEVKNYNRYLKLQYGEYK